MSERPRRLHFSATFVVWASEVLTPGEKIVWYHDWALDRGPEAAWISATQMAVRCGMKARTVEAYRTRLKALGLHEAIARPGGRTCGWIATLPAQCIPHGTRGAGDEAVQLAQTLDTHIRDRDRWLARSASGSDPHEDRGSTPMSVGDQPPSASGIKHDGRRGVGGKGGAPSSKRSSASLHPPKENSRKESAVAQARRTEKQDGDGISKLDQLVMDKWQRKRAG